MKPAQKSKSVWLKNEDTGQMQEVIVVAECVLFEERKLKPFHGDNFTGRYPIHLNGKKKTSRRKKMVPYESSLECSFLEWVEECTALKDVVRPPLQVRGMFDAIPRRYAPNFLVEMDPVPWDLKRIGFGSVTFVEVKPSKFVDNWDVQLKLELLKLATGLPAVLITELTMSLSILNKEQREHVH